MGKITKDISNLSKLPHPQSRKVAQLTKKVIRQDHRKKKQQQNNIRTNVAAEKYIWFQNEMSAADVCSASLLLQSVTKYLSRFDEELEQITLKHEIGGKRNRQHASREDIIKMTKSNEENEFKTCGIELPDVFNPKQFKLLKTWNGEMRFLQNFKLARFNKTRLESLVEKEKSKTKDEGTPISMESVEEESTEDKKTIETNTSSLEMSC